MEKPARLTSLTLLRQPSAQPSSQSLLHSRASPQSPRIDRHPAPRDRHAAGAAKPSASTWDQEPLFELLGQLLLGDRVGLFRGLIRVCIGFLAQTLSLERARHGVNPAKLSASQALVDALAGQPSRHLGNFHLPALLRDV